jgi:hypothetical protein
VDSHGHDGPSRDRGRGHDRDHSRRYGGALGPCCRLGILRSRHNESMWVDSSRVG